jgi:fatty-acyl-CoA synthase
VIDVDALQAKIRAAKGAIQCPKEVVIVDSLPQTPLGKIDKVQLRAPHWDGHLRQV